MRTHQRIRYELKIREVEVARIEAVGANTLAITFAGDAFADFDSASFDDHVKFVFEAGGEKWRRDYTPRHFNREKRELTLEFALHEEGRASDWARSAQVGQSAVIAGPRGSMIIAQDYDWHLLAGDLSALPAIRRRLEELPADARVFVIALASDSADHCPLPGHAEVRWARDEAAFLAQLRAFSPPAGEGFAWYAGESALAAATRAILLEKGVPKDHMRVAAYWKRGQADFHERLD